MTQITPPGPVRCHVWTTTTRTHLPLQCHLVRSANTHVGYADDMGQKEKNSLSQKLNGRTEEGGGGMATCIVDWLDIGVEMQLE